MQRTLFSRVTSSRCGSLSLWIACIAFFAWAIAPVPAQVLEDATAAFAKRMRRGAGLTIVRADDGRLLHESAHGQWSPDAVVPIASSSKWLTTVVILALVERGDLDLDRPVAGYLPQIFAGRDALAGLTLDHCLSCTNGLREPLLGRRMHLAKPLHEQVKKIVSLEPHEPPGTALRYGSPGFTVAAFVAETVTGRTWHALFDELVRVPLQLQHTAFGRFRWGEVIEVGETDAPHCAGGAVSTQREYGRFVGMLATGGTWDGEQVLRAASIEKMLVPRTLEIDVAVSPFERYQRLAARRGVDPGPAVHYGLGTWVEKVDEQGVALVFSDGGAFGWMPWVDREAGIAGVLAVRDRMPRVIVPARALRQLAHDTFLKDASADGTASVTNGK